MHFRVTSALKKCKTFMKDFFMTKTLVCAIDITILTVFYYISCIFPELYNNINNAVDYNPCSNQTSALFVLKFDNKWRVNILNKYKSLTKTTNKQTFKQTKSLCNSMS